MTEINMKCPCCNDRKFTESEVKIDSLITTIESLQEQFERLKLHAEHLQTLVNGQDQSHAEYVNETETLIEQKDVLIESQKEEIKRLCTYNEMHVNKIIDRNEEILKLEDSVESLKAITELAVKGLKEIRENEFVAKRVSRTTLSEIAKLSNEKVEYCKHQINTLSFCVRCEESHE